MAAGRLGVGREYNDLSSQKKLPYYENLSRASILDTFSGATKTSN
jgi:hypothetical protein